jgi:hypothetical protein
MAVTRHYLPLKSSARTNIVPTIHSCYWSNMYIYIQFIHSGPKIYARTVPTVSLETTTAVHSLMIYHRPMFLIRETRWVCENIAQNVAHPTFCQNHYTTFFYGKRGSKIWATPANFKELCKVNNDPINRIKFVQAGTDVMIFKYFRLKKFAKNWRFWLKTKLNFEKVDHNIGI